MTTINVSGYKGSIGSLNIVSGSLSLNGGAGTAGQYLLSQGAGALPQWANGATNRLEMYIASGDGISVPASTNLNLPMQHTQYNTFGTNFTYGSQTFTNIGSTTMILLVCFQCTLGSMPAGKSMTLLLNQTSNSTYQYGTSVLQNGTATSTYFGNSGAAVIVLGTGDSISPIVSHTNSSSLSIVTSYITIVQIG